MRFHSKIIMFQDTFQETLFSFWTTVCCHVIMFKALHIANSVAGKQNPLGHTLHINQTTNILGSFHFLKALQNSKALPGGEGRSQLGKYGQGSTMMPPCTYPVFIHSCIYYFLRSFMKYLSSTYGIPGGGAFFKIILSLR